MARVTVEDCVDKVENRFELVLLAGHRARMIASGSALTIARDNDKNPVVALREIADETVSPDDLKEDLIHSLQKYVEVDEPEQDVPLLTGGDDDVARGQCHRLRSHVRGRAAARPREHGSAGQAGRFLVVPRGASATSRVKLLVAAREPRSYMTKHGTGSDPGPQPVAG